MDEIRGEKPDVRLAVHDATRLEWSVSVRVPERGELPCTIELELEIPSHLFPRHTQWDHFQQFARLDAEEVGAADTSSVDGLRRHTVALATRLARVSEGFARHCRLVLSPLAAGEDHEGALRLWIDTAVRLVAEARASLVAAQIGDGEEVRRERELVDEYASVRLLELFGAAERALAELRRDDERASPDSSDALPLDLDAVDAHLADALHGELEYRRAHRFVDAGGGSAAALERYIERASLLKKHFQEVMFLEPERYSVTSRVHHLAAALVAVLASTWALAWQLALDQRQSATVGSGVFAFALVAGLVYAGKDRIKEVGRAWLAGKVERHYAHRVVRYRAPSRTSPQRAVLLRARESFFEEEASRTDPLNPGSKARSTFTVVRYVQRAEVGPRAGGTATQRVKQVFRYDLSPLLPRLDDRFKRIPVLDAGERRVRLAKAPRCYRFPVRLRVACGAAVHEEEGMLVLHKRGLDRIERKR